MYMQTMVTSAGGETFLHLKVYSVTRIYTYIYIYKTASEFFFFLFFFFFFPQEILRSAVERKDLFVLPTLRDEYLKTPLSLLSLSLMFAIVSLRT